jgi:sugar phosphate isomerase/epimerase
MKISFCSIAFQKNKWGNKNRPEVEVPIQQIVPLVADAGYDGIEIWYGHLRDLDHDAKIALREQLAEAGLVVPMVSPYFDFTSSAESAAHSVEHGQEVLQDAQLIGARAVRVFTGKTGSADANADQWKMASSSLQQLCDADPALLWLLETHSWNLMDTVDGTLRLVNDVGRENLRVNFQPSTFGVEHRRALNVLSPFIKHVHATNARDGKTAGLEEGTKLDWAEIIGELQERDFRDFVSVEWMGEEPEEAVRREAAYLKSLPGIGS